MEYIKKLQGMGFKFIVDNNQIHYEFEGDLPEGAEDLLNQLKEDKQRAIEYLTFDVDKALDIFGDALKWFDENSAMLPDTFDFVMRESPEIYDRYTAAENGVDTSIASRDMEKVNKAAEEFKAALMAIFQSHPAALKKYEARKSKGGQKKNE